VAADIFAKIGDIKGESPDDKHKDEVEVLSWSWGVSQSGSIIHGGGGGEGKATFNDFNFTHHVDKASPRLLKACATGEHIKDATITVRKAGKGQQEFLIIKMSDIIVTSVSPSGAGEGSATAEHVALQFAKVDLEYRPQKTDGSLDAGIHFKYDIKGNKEG
jgi:type VI secretion system secreted protein Hcp